MLRGTEIIVRSVEGKPEKKILWEDEGSLKVLTVTEDGWQKRETLLPDLTIISKESVFKWNASLFQELVKAADKPSELESLWQKAEPWEDLEPVEKKFKVEV